MDIKNINDYNSDEIVFLSDVHFGVRGNSVEWLENISEYFDKFFIPFVQNRIQLYGKTPAIIVAGDYFDNRDTIDIKVHNVAVDIMETLSSFCHVYMLIGNHDIYKKSSNDINSLRIFKYFNNVSVIENPSIIDFDKLNMFVGMIPWCVDSKTGTNLLNDFRSDCRLIVMHAEINGMTLDNNRPILNGVDTTTLVGTKIYSGHIHKRQESEKCNYIGSPYQTKRSDMFNSPGIYYIDSNNGSLVEQFEPNTFSPVFKRLKYEDIVEKKFDVEKEIRNNYIDIVVKESDSRDVKVTKFIEDLMKYEPRRIELFIDKSEHAVNEEMKNEASGDMNITDLFKANINKMGLKSNEIKTLDEMNRFYFKQANDILGSDLN